MKNKGGANAPSCNTRFNSFGFVRGVQRLFCQKQKTFPLHYVLIGGIAGLLPDLDIAVFYIFSFRIHTKRNTQNILPQPLHSITFRHNRCSFLEIQKQRTGRTPPKTKKHTTSDRIRNTHPLNTRLNSLRIRNATLPLLNIQNRAKHTAILPPNLAIVYPSFNRRSTTNPLANTPRKKTQNKQLLIDNFKNTQHLLKI